MVSEGVSIFKEENGREKLIKKEAFKEQVIWYDDN